jgi:hypothetical protein
MVRRFRVTTQKNNSKEFRDARKAKISEYGLENIKWLDEDKPTNELKVDINGYIEDIPAFTYSSGGKEILEEIIEDEPDKEQDVVRAGNRRTGAIQGPGSMTGKFSLNMFRGQSWITEMDKLLEIFTYNEEGQKVVLFPQIMDKGIMYAAQLFVDILNELFELTEFDKLLQGKTIDESTRAFADEPMGDYTEQGGYSRGVVPKKVENVMSEITKGIETIIEDLIMYLHETLDEDIGAGRDIKLDTTITKLKDFQDADELPMDIVNWIWSKINDHVKYSLEQLQDDILVQMKIIARKLEYPLEVNEGVFWAMDEVHKSENTKRFASLIYLSVLFKSAQGMAGRSENPIDRRMGDILSQKERDWIEANTQRETTQMGPMTIERESPPDIDERTGILKPVQTDATTGEEYYIPQDIGIADSDFDPADEVFEEDEELAAQGPVEETPSYTKRKPQYTRDREGNVQRTGGKSNAPNVKGYKRGKGARVPPEWQQFQEKNASVNSPTKDWFSVLKKEQFRGLGGHPDDAANTGGRMDLKQPSDWPVDKLNYRGNFGKLYGHLNNVVIPRHEAWSLRDKENQGNHKRWAQQLRNYMKETKEMIKEKESKHGFQKPMK